MANAGSITYYGEIDTRGFDKDARRMERGAEGIGDVNEEQAGRSNKAWGRFAKIGLAAVAAAAVGVGAVIAKNMSGAVRRIDTLNNSTRVFENLGFRASDIDKAMQDLDASIDGLPTSLDAAVLGMQNLSASTGDIGRGQKIFESLNNAVLGLGGDSQQVEGATLAMARAIDKGRLQGQEWQMLMTAGLGPALKNLADEMGITTGALQEGLSDGSISMEDFEKSLLDANENGAGSMASFQKQAEDATSGIGTSWTRMQISIQRGIAKVIDAIGSERIAGVLGGLRNFIDSGANAVVGFIENLKVFKNWLEENAGAIKQVAIVILIFLTPAIITFGIKAAGVFLAYMVGVAKSALATFKASLLMAKSWLLALGPIGLIVAAVVAAVALIIMNWDTVKGWLLAFWEWLKTTASDAWNKIKDIFGGVGRWFGDRFNQVRDLITGAFNTARDRVISAFGGVLGFFRNLPGRILSALGNMGKLLFNTGKDLINGLLDGAGSLLKNIGKFFLDLVPGWIRGPFEKALGISSPSKIFGEYGLNIMQGLSGGIDDNSGMAQNALDGVGMNVKPQISSFDTSLQGNGRGANGASVTVNMNGVMARSRGDLREIGKDIVRAINDELVAKQQPPIGNGAI